MTNGEKIQTILDIDKDCTEVYGKNGMMTFSVPQDWWNAEYKEPVIRDNGVKNELNRVKNELGVTSGLEKNSKKLENPTKKYCGCCKHWKIKGVQKIGDKPTSYGKCTKLSISGFEVETTFNDNCSSEGLE